MKTFKIIAFSLMLISLYSCYSPNQLVKFTPKPKDVFTNSNLKSFLNSNPKANIVLRIPNASEDVTTKSTNSNIIATSADSKQAMDIYYNAIEKEFLKGGFSVRDRGLFNEVLKKMSRDNTGNINYSQIKDLTNTDLIVEVIKIDPSVQYVTNRTYTVDKRGKQTEKTSQIEYKQYGASAEFKIIMVKNNEMAGSYTFNYSPCREGCLVSSLPKRPVVKLKGLKTTEVAAYEGVERDIMEDFIRRCAQDLITSLKS